MACMTHTDPSPSRSLAGEGPERLPHRCERKLRIVLRVNAASSAVSGSALAIAPAAFADVLDVGRPGWVRIVGLALIPFAAVVAWLSFHGVDRLRSFTPAIVAGDAAWVLASGMTLALGWYSDVGVALIVAMAVIVGTFGVLQWTAWKHLEHRGRTSHVPG